MAVYFDLGIDCGCSEQVADRLAHHFESMTIKVRGLPDVQCEVWRKENHGHHFVGVWPRGMGYGTTRFQRPELLQDEHQLTIKQALYERLSGTSGYRRALFGGEAFDVLSEGTPEELMAIDYSDMIYSDQEFRNPPPSCTVDTFSPGYRIVMAARAELGAPPNGGPAMRPGNSGAGGGPPSVS